MKLTFIIELLVIAILIAFAASRVIDEPSHSHGRAIAHHHHNTRLSTQKLRQEANTAANKYCTCNTKLCNCCREFNIPVVSLQGPGCASLQYLRGDKLAISMSFGERVLTNTTIDSRKPKPVCMPLPGGVSKFCGRVYNIARQGEDFNACLGLELKALKDVEAALRVSCFKFGPKGLKVSESQPLPPIESVSVNNEEDDDEDDDDDDDDEFDFDDVDDIDDDDDDDEDDGDEDDNAVDYSSFGVFDDDFIGIFGSEDDDGGNKRRRTTTKPPQSTPTRRTVNRKPVISTPAPLKTVTKKIAPVVSSTVASSTVQTIQTQTTPKPTRRTRTTVRRRVKPTKSQTLPSSTILPSTKIAPSAEEAIPEVNIIEDVTRVISVPVTTTTTTTTTTRKPVTKTVTTRTTTTTTPLPETTPSPETTEPTTELVGLITSATIVTSEKKPQEASNPEVALPDKPISSNIIVSPHESIAAVAAMLQTIPGEATTSQENQQTQEAVKVAPAPTTEAGTPSTEKIHWITLNYIQNKPEVTTEMPEVSEVPTTEQITDVQTTEVLQTTTEDEDDEEDDTVTLKSYIIKNDDPEEESEVTTENITESVGTTESLQGQSEKSKKDKPESKDVLTDIIDGVVGTFVGDSEEDKDKPSNNDQDDDDDDDDDFLGDDDDDEDDDDDDDKKKPEQNKDEKTEDDDDDDDEDDEDEKVSEKDSNIENDEDDDDDEDDEDDFVSRKAKQHQKVNAQSGARIVRGRQSRDMWLDRLHW